MIFFEYIKTFNNCDTIIKNYYTSDIELLRYLFINFIYNFYKNLEKEDINLNLTINGVGTTINKSYETVCKEITDMIANNDFLYNSEAINIIKGSGILTEEVQYFLAFVYDYTKKPSGTEIMINNSNELNIFIVMELLSSEAPINLTINGISYQIPNIKNKPYKFKFIMKHLL